ncbi:hypothetical protein RCL1_003732 [Eukaryota sp. TZLM3-RCL]
MTTFSHNTIECLLRCLKETMLTDFELTFNDQTVLCHRAIVSQSSKRLQTLIQKNQDSYDLGDDDEACIDHLVSIINSFYGEVLDLNADNTVPLLFISKSLSCSDLSAACKNFVKTHDQPSQSYQLSVEMILQNLSNDHFQDYQIAFNDRSLHIHKFLFAAMSPYFRTKFSRNWQESEDNCSDFSKLLQVSASSFSNFFDSFYTGKLEVNLENAFDYSHLAWYFQLSELERFCNNFIQQSKAEYSWVTSSVLKAINSEDYRFIQIISTKISEIPDLSNCDPIAVHPLFFENLNSNIDVSWLLKCLVSSCSHYSEQKIWTPKSLEKSIENVKFDTLPVDKIYQIIEPMFSISDLFDFLLSFSLSIFSKFTSEVPLNWFLWFIVESDLRKEFSLISQVSKLLNEIFTPENISQVPITSFNSETLRLFAINSKKEHLVLWMINCLIEVWSSSQLNVEDFLKILMSIDISESQYELVYPTLSRLFSDEILRPILFEFNSLKLVPRLLKDALEEKKRLGIEMSKQEKLNIEQLQFNAKQKEINNEQSKTDEELKRINNEQRLLIAEQEKRINELQNQISVITTSIQQMSDHYKSKLEVELKKLREDQNKIYEVKFEEQKRINEKLQNQLVAINKVLEPVIKQQQVEAEQKRLEELVEQQALEAQLKQEFIDKGGAKFLASNKGINLRLSENDLVVTKCGEHGPDNSFVAIQRPVQGKIVLSYVNRSDFYYTSIGFFDPSYTQTDDCVSNSLYNPFILKIFGGMVQITVDNESISVSLSAGEPIMVEFNGNEVTFSFPCGYAHTLPMLDCYVFGVINIVPTNLSWHLSTN